MGCRGSHHMQPGRVDRIMQVLQMDWDKASWPHSKASKKTKKRKVCAWCGNRSQTLWDCSRILGGPPGDLGFTINNPSKSNGIVVGLFRIVKNTYQMIRTRIVLSKS